MLYNRSLGISPCWALAIAEQLEVSVSSHLVIMGVYVRPTGLTFAASNFEWTRDKGRKTNTVFNTDPETYLKKKSEVPVTN